MFNAKFVFASLPRSSGIPRTLNLRSAAILIGLLAILFSAAASAKPLKHADLNRIANDNGREVSVIIRLKESESVRATRARESAAVRKIKRKQRRDQKISRINSRLGKSKRAGKFRNPKLFTLAANRNELAQLLNDPEIDVFENRLHRPSLENSVPVVFPDQATSNFDGSGWAVAILDTGVSKTHTFYSDNIIEEAEACFSNQDTAGVSGDFESLCPNGGGSEFGDGAGVNCSASISLCDHGTKMAGIVAGSSVTRDGVATGAGLIPVQIFTKVNDSDFCGGAGTPCIGATDIDIINALEYIHGLRNTIDIASVNLSLGVNNTVQGFCDTDVLKPAIDDLRAAGIATIAATGNNSNNLSLDSPACISSAISVAATATDNSDNPYHANNRNNTLDFFAPGVGVTTSILPASTFGADIGTSIAAPHVSAAWAVLKEAGANSVTQIESLLDSTGASVSQGAGVTASRINITAAIAQFESMPNTGDDDELCVPVKTKNGKVALICL